MHQSISGKLAVIGLIFEVKIISICEETIRKFKTCLCIKINQTDNVHLNRLIEIIGNESSNNSKTFQFLLFKNLSFLIFNNYD